MPYALDVALWRFSKQASIFPAVCASLQPTTLRYGISADQAHRFGLPCGGTVELVLKPVSAHSRLDELLQACQQRRSTE